MRGGTRYHPIRGKLRAGDQRRIQPEWHDFLTELAELGAGRDLELP